MCFILVLVFEFVFFLSFLSYFIAFYFFVVVVVVAFVFVNEEIDVRYLQFEDDCWGLTGKH